MRRSSLVVLTIVLVGMFLSALPAAAVTSANVESPEPDQTVTDSAAVRVSVSRGVNDPNVSSVRARLSRSGSDTYSAVELSCLEGCDASSASQRWVGSFNPRAPFGGSGRIRNGTWYIQPSVNSGDFGSGVKIYVSLPPSPVTNLKASSQEGAVQLTWTRAPEPDISGYRVERSTSDGWQEVAQLGSDAASYTHRVPDSGTYSYRVVSVRPKGTPSGGDYTVASTSASANVSAPAPDPPQYTKPPTRPESDAAQGGNANAGSGSGSATGKPVEATGRGGDSAEGAPGGSGGGPRARRAPLAGNVPPPPPARRGFSFSLRSLAQAFGYQSPDEAGGDEESYFGEGEGFSEELDYSGVDPVTGEPIAVPLRDTGLQATLISHLIDRPLLVSLAVGLLFVILAVFILRWIRRSPAHVGGQGSPPTASTMPSPAPRRFFKARGEPATPARAPSPTTAPLSPRVPTQTRPVRAQDAGGTTNGRRAAASTPERHPTRPSETGSPSAPDAEARRDSRNEPRSRASDLFAPRRSPATPPSPRDRWDSATGSETVKVLRPPSSRETGETIR